jgi:hypothetical protein
LLNLIYINNTFWFVNVTLKNKKFSFEDIETLLKICQQWSVILKLNRFRDLIFTISGEVDQQKISLDSIQLEDLSNDQRILFDNLPVMDYYQINLSQNVLWGNVNARSTAMKQEFVETINLPGLIQVAYRGNVPA